MAESKDPDRTHDTDPLADTQTSDEPSASASTQTKRRSVDVGDSLDGRYELLENVGEGGMATVYRARDNQLRRDVAVKVMFPHLARRDEVVHRFHREARAAAGLEHANILRVYDVGGGDSDGSPGGAVDPPFIVMELVRGHSLLGEIERRGPMLAEVAACIGALLADALAVAHKAGIIHRDIKPANVMIDGKGRVLLADFGVARLETEDSLVTKTGALLGTPAYMSPEQASGDTATAKSDLYSLGATLYQLATGHLPYTGSPAKVLAQIAQGSLVSAVKKRTEVGPDLSRLIDRLMAADATARPASAAEVASELRAMCTAGGFGEAKDELAAYFADPDAFVKAKTPSVVAALVKAGETAIREGKLPRAIAIAGRASALAPDDPAVVELVASVTEGGRASQRRKIIAMAGIGVLVAGGATAGAVFMFGRNDQHHAALDGSVALSLEASVADDATRVATALLDATPDPLDAPPEPAVDAAVALVRRDAGVPSGRLRDAAIATVVVDAHAQVAITPDAAPAIARPDAAAPAANGFLIVTSDAWCDVKIDGADKGRAGPNKIEVAAGTHTIRCEQGSLGKSWTKQVTIAAGATVKEKAYVLGAITVTFAVGAEIGGISYPAGATAQLRGDRYEVKVGDRKNWVTISRPCQIRSSPEISCY